MKRIGVFGGTFNPPHTGHADAARTAAAELMLDRLILVPAGIPPHKSISEESASPEARYAMTVLAAHDIPGSEVSDIEIRRTGKSYTADTLRQLMADEPECEYWLIVGGDMFLSLDQWYDAAWLKKNICIAVMARADDIFSIEAETRSMEEQGIRVKFIRKRIIEISSTELREMLPKRCGVDYLNDEVYSYIIRNKLYGALPNLDWLRKKAIALLKPSRIPHVLGTEKTAVELAKRWGVDEMDARTAALLHDCTKRLTVEEQLKLSEEYGTIADISSGTPEKLIHAITGAELAKHRFGVSDEIYGAIRWHTSGRPDMTMLEKIIWLADCIEPNRTFKEVPPIRKLAFSDIDKALYAGLKMTIESVRKRGLPEDGMTLRALEFYGRRA